MGPQPVTSVPLGWKLPLPSPSLPFIVMLGFRQLQHLHQESEKEDSPSSTSDPAIISSPPWPQLSSKDVIESLCPKTAKKL